MTEQGASGLRRLRGAPRRARSGAERILDRTITRSIRLGERSERAERFRTAATCHRAALLLARQPRWLGARDFARSSLELNLHNLGLNHLEADRGARAIRPLERALALNHLNALEGLEPHLEAANLLSLLGAASGAAARHEQACRYFVQELEIRRMEGDKEAELTALSNLARAQADYADSHADKEWRQAALESFVAQLGLADELDDRAMRAEALYNGSLALMEMSYRGDEVVGWLATAVATWEEFARENPGDWGRHHLTKLLIRQGRCFVDREEWARALAPLRTAVEQAEGRECRCLLSAIRALIRALGPLGDHAAAERYLRRAIARCRETGDSDEAEFRWRLGSNLAEQGAVADGLRTVEEAVAMAEELPPGRIRTSELSLALGSLGILLNNHVSSYERAAESFSRSVELARQLGSEKSQAPPLLNLGIALRNRGGAANLERSSAALREALELHTRLDEPKLEGETHDALALTYRTRGETDLAIKHYELAANIYRSRGKPKMLIETLAALAELPNLPPGRVVGYLKAAAEVGARTGDSAAEAHAMRELARVRRSVGLESGAAEFHRRGIAIVESARARLDSSVERRALLEAHAALYADAAALAHRRHEDRSAFRYAEAGRARLALDQRAEVAASQIADPELRQRRRELATEIGARAHHLERLGIHLLKEEGTGAEATDGVADEAAGIEADLKRLEAEWEDLQSTLAVENPRFAARVRAGIDSVWSVPKIQEELLGPDAVLLEYLVAEDVCLGFAIAKDHFAAFEVPLDASALETMVTELCEAMEEGDAGYPHGHALYKALIQPAASVVEGKREVLICPNGPLHRLPFAALLREDPMKGVDGAEPRFARRWASLPYFLRDSMHIRYIASATTEGLLRQAEASESADYQSELLALGAPLASIEGAAAKIFPPLDFALAELGAIAGGFEPAQVISRPRTETEPPATKDGALELLDGGHSGYRFVHFATHAHADDRSPWLSALIFEPEPGDGGAPGYLHANEAIDLRLPAECVTMSGCHTLGAAEPAGEGVIGLASAFRHAGARNVCASLWEVGDESTAELMGHFYAGLRADPTSPAAALAGAQRKLIEQGYHPRHWTAFGIFG